MRNFGKRHENDDKLISIIINPSLQLIQFTHVLGGALFQGGNVFDAHGILLVSGILLQTLGVTGLNLRTGRILQGIHRLVVALRDLDVVRDDERERESRRGCELPRRDFIPIIFL